MGGGEASSLSEIVCCSGGGDGGKRVKGGKGVRNDIGKGGKELVPTVLGVVDSVDGRGEIMEMGKDAVYLGVCRISYLT